jgi:hypothetical protein
VTAVSPPPTRPPRLTTAEWRRRRRRRPLLYLAALVVLAASGAAAIAAYARFWQPVTLTGDPAALAHLELAPVGVTLESVSVTSDGTPLPVERRQRRIWPERKVAAGSKLDVVVTVRRSGWLSWAAGKTAKVHLTAVAPAAHVTARVVRASAGEPVSVRFDTPVARATVAHGSRVSRATYAHPRRTIATGVEATTAHRAGTVLVRAAPRSWETLGPAERVSWFPPGSGVQALVAPATAADLAPTNPLVLTLSEPVAQAFGSDRPTIEPATPGRWVDVDDDTIEFRPSGAGFALGSHVHVKLPAAVTVVSGSTRRTTQTLDWHVPPGTTLRLQQLLARLAYLPLTWQPAAEPVSLTARAQTQAAIEPPAGSFAWRFPKVPQQLRSLWKEGNWSVLVQGALMHFQHDNGLTVDGIPGPDVWRTLVHDVLTNRHNRSGYSYVLVHRNVPQTLVLYHGGKVVLSARVNTGVAGAPTALGTWPVFERLSTATMSGTNPDGSHYHDEGIRWVSYFHGGEAIHGFNRASYGYPQSVGCVEAPVATAGKIWPYTPIGTLVTITP